MLYSQSIPSLQVLEIYHSTHPYISQSWGANLPCSPQISPFTLRQTFWSNLLLRAEDPSAGSFRTPLCSGITNQHRS